MYLRYNELRLLMADQGAFDAKELVSDRRDYREDAAERRPPSWVGTATQTALDFPYNALWGFPEKFYAGEPSTTGEVKGLAASPGVVEGPARFVASLDEFDQVKDGEILVCRMTNPAWVVLFTKITGLVTEAGGAVSHPAVVAREFGIPAVVGTTNAGERIKTGDRIRVNGTTGVVEILSVTEPEWMAPDSLEEALALRAERGDEATVLAGGTFLGILMNQGFLAPARCCRSAASRSSSASTWSTASCGSARWSRTGASSARSAAAGRCWRARSGWWRARACATSATVGGVLADADYASRPAGDARRARRPRGAALAARRP